MNDETELTPLVAIMDEEDAHAADIAADAQKLSDYREAAERATSFFKRWASAIKKYSSKKRGTGFALDCACHALGWFEITGCWSQIELAQKWKCEKENVRKLVSLFQKVLGAPPTPGQRSEQGRKKMSDKRKGQLK